MRAPKTSTLHRISLGLMLVATMAFTPAMAAPSPEDAEVDPYEGFNRAMFAFNEKFDAWLLKPAAQAYDAVFPAVVKTGVSNFFRNLRQPLVIANDFLQGKGEQGFEDMSRLLLNSTIGLVGLFDVATDLGIPLRDEDFGQTLAVWGMEPGPYFVWPIIGPRFARDTLGWGVDFLAHPVTHVDDDSLRWSAWGLELVDARRLALPAEKVLKEAAGEDKYLFVREAYRQRRQYLIYDGRPPRPEFFDDEPPPNNAKGQ